MSVLLISTPRKDDAFQNIIHKAWSTKQSPPVINDWQVITVDLSHENYPDQKYTKGGVTSFIHLGLVEYKDKPAVRKGRWGDGVENTMRDLVFEGTESTLANLIDSFLYAKLPQTENSKKGNAFKRYGPGYSPVVIFVFVKQLTAKISQLIAGALGIDEFGRTLRKVYVVAIPLFNKNNSGEVNEQESVDQYVYVLAKLLSRKVAIRDVLSVFPGSRHFAQHEQFDSDEDEAGERKQSLRKALDFSMAKKLSMKLSRENALVEFLNENKSNITGLLADGNENLVLDEEVNCTVYAPKDVKVGNEFMVQVFTHTYVQTFELDALARNADNSAELRISTVLNEKLPRGSKIEFQLSITGLIIEDHLLPTIWNGKINHVQFSVKVPGNFAPGDLIGKVLVLQNSVPIGQMKFKIRIAPKDELIFGWRKHSSTMARFEKAFISYASQDRPEVLKRVQMLNLVKLDFFQDLLTLEPGDKWEAKIHDYIKACDVFFVFWSKAASESEWVKKETLYALKIKKGNTDAPPEIIPVIIEGPPPAKPPKELSFLHFNDKMIYFIGSP